MKTSTTFCILVLCIGAIAADEIFDLFDRQPGDRPIFINTLISNETEELTRHFVSYEWFGVNETFTQVFIETPSFVIESVWINFPNATHPLYQRTFKLEIVACNTQLLHVNLILFGFVDQPPTYPGANVSLLGSAENMTVKRIINHV